MEKRIKSGMPITHFPKSKTDFKNQILGAKISKMLIFNYISYINLTKFRISKSVDTEKSAFCQI
jgi:hypothetical protein